MIKTTQDLKKMGRILGIWAHPDDETFSSGGIMAAAVQNGQAVAFITATRGEKGIQDEARWPAEKLGGIRSVELETAMELLGVKEHFWLDLPDGGCNKVDEPQVIKRIAECIEQFNPNSILTFGPEGMTGHPDHQAVSAWASKACQSCGSQAKIYHATLTPEQYEAAKDADEKLNMFFNIEEPPVCNEGNCSILFGLDEELCNLKVAALKAMPSQYAEMAPFFEGKLRTSFGVEAFTDARQA